MHSLSPFTVPTPEQRRENIERLRAHIEADFKNFYMGSFGDNRAALRAVEQREPCGTTMCLCGWVNMIRLEDARDGKSREIPEQLRKHWDLGDVYFARNWLGLGDLNLFYTMTVDFLNHEGARRSLVNQLLDGLIEDPDYSWEDAARDLWCNAPREYKQSKEGRALKLWMSGYFSDLSHERT